MKYMSFHHRKERLAILGFASYEDYTKSRAWKKKRREYEAIGPRKRCYVCNKPPHSRDKLQLHHKTYERLGEELIDDLVWLCGQCHTSAHKLEESGEATLWDCADILRKRAIDELNLAMRKKKNGKPDWGGKTFNAKPIGKRKHRGHGKVARTAAGKAREAPKCSCGEPAVFNGRCFGCLKS